MAILVSMAIGSPANRPAVGNQTMNFIVTVANSNVASVVLTSLVVSGPTSTQLSQPVFLTPNVPVGVGNPIILPGSSAIFGFQCIFTNPTMPGPAPDAPGGAAPTNAAYYPDAVYELLAISVTSDGTVASGGLTAPVITATIPQDNGGAFVFTQGFNLINLLVI